MSKNMNKRATKRKSATENSILKFLTVSSVSSDSIVKGIITTFYQVSVHLAKLFQRWLLEIDQPETKIAYGGYVC